MKKLSFSFFFMIVIFAGCSTVNTTVKTEDVSSDKDESSKDGDNQLTDLKNLFEKNGYTFSYESASKNILAGERMNVSLKKKEILQAFVYNSKEDADADAKYISYDGTFYEKDNQACSIDWIAPPHFYKYNNLIILYLGDNEDLLKVLSSNFGDQIAGQ